MSRSYSQNELNSEKEKDSRGEQFSASFMLPRAVFFVVVCLFPQCVVLQQSLPSIQKVTVKLRNHLSTSLTIHFISLQLPLEHQKALTP